MRHLSVVDRNSMASRVLNGVVNVTTAADVRRSNQEAAVEDNRWSPVINGPQLYASFPYRHQTNLRVVLIKAHWYDQ